jgi:hypothetical protein
VGREGWRLFQSWGEYGYTLREWLERGGARLRGWKEGKGFVGTFDGLAGAEVGGSFVLLGKVDC